MGDVFKEQIVKRKSTAKDFFIKVALALGVALVFFIGLTFLGPMTLLVTFAAGFGAYYLIGRTNREYEYIFTNGELDIDVIYNRSSRKRLFTASVKSFDVMGHIDDPGRAHAFAGAQAVVDYSSGVPGPDTYAFLFNHNGKRTKFLIEPNEAMRELFAKAMGRTKFYPRNG